MELSAWDWMGRLATAAVLSGVIGFEREARHKAAGLRTHILVGMGAALFTVAGIDGLDSADSSRMAAAVVTGIGFLGAGAIFRHGMSVRGLTTAAGLWVVAAIGVVAGAGDVLPALGATALAAVTLNGLSLVETSIQRRSERKASRIRVALASSRALGDTLSVLSGVDERSRECDVRMADDGSIDVTFIVDRSHANTVLALLSGLDGVIGVEDVSGR